MSRQRTRIATVAALVFAIAIPALRAVDVTWDGSTDMTWSQPDATSWSGDTYQSGDTANFAGAGQGAVTIDVGGVTPGAINVTAGSYTFAGDAIGGAGGMTIGDATLAIGQAYQGLVYSGDTTLNAGGLLRIDHNVVDGHPSNRSLGGTTVLDGGTLRFNHTGAGHFNPVLTFTSGITVGANGGTIDFSGNANNFNTNLLSAPTLGGDLTITGVTGSPNGNGSPYKFTDGTLTLTANAKITNNTTKPANAPHDIWLSGIVSGQNHTLNLAQAGTGGAIRFVNPTATSINLANLVVESGATLSLDQVGDAVNPLSQIKANGGSVTMSPGSTFNVWPAVGNWNHTGPQFDASAVVWQGDNTLNVQRATGGNSDTFFHVIGADMEVSAASGLTTLNVDPWRGRVTVDSPHALIVGEQGLLRYTSGASTVRGTFRGNLELHGGAIVEGINVGTDQGGIIRDGGGTLTLGDGSAGVVTFQGNHGTGTQVFKLGFTGYVTDNGNLTMRYANTNAAAGSAFNFGWSASANQISNSALNAFQETSGGTEFAPLAGSGGVAIVGATAGTVATFANPATLTTTGTVGFYNAGANNTRGALGAVEIANGGNLATQGGGTVQAATVTVDAGGSLSGVGAFDAPIIDVAGTVAPGNSIGILTMGSETNPTLVTFSVGSELAIELQGSGTAGFDYDVLVVHGDVIFEAGAVLNLSYLGYTPSLGESWDILQADSVTGFELLGLPDKHLLSFSDGVLTLSMIPEPSAALLLALGGLVALRRRRR